MNYREKILDHYRVLLAIGWLAVDDDGFVSLAIGDDVRPATINGKRVILPTREQMQNKDWSNRIGFHPIRESYNLGISEPLANLRDQYVMRLNASIAYFMKELLALAYDQKNHKNLSTEQGQVLNALSTVTENTVKNFEDLQKKTRGRNDADQFINIFIRKGGMVKGQTYGRAAIITFPLYEKLKEGGEKINGVKFSAKDRALLVRLYEFVFPTIVDKEAFNVGINSKTAPFLEALIRSTFNVVDLLVETSTPYLPLVAMPEILSFPEAMGDWIEIFDHKDLAEKLAMSIPNLSRTEDLVAEIEESERSERRDPVRQETSSSTVEKSHSAPAPAPARGRMIMGASSSSSTSSSGEGLGKSQPDQDRASVRDRAPSGIRSVSRDSDLDREADRRKREEAEAERRRRDREDEEDRIARRRLREEDDRRYRERQRERDDERRRDDRGRDRDDRYDRDRDSGRERDRDDRDYDRKTGDVFEDNPVLRSNLRDERDRGRRSYYDGRRDGHRVRDIRDRGRDDRYDDDRYDRGRDREYRYRR